MSDTEPTTKIFRILKNVNVFKLFIYYARKFLTDC